MIPDSANSKQRRNEIAHNRESLMTSDLIAFGCAHKRDTMPEREKRMPRLVAKFGAWEGFTHITRISTHD